MNQHSAFLELCRWGYANVPGIILHYSKELDIEVEDIGILTAIFYTFERSKPLFQLGVEVGQVIQACPALSKNKLSRRLAHLTRLEIIGLTGSSGFSDKVITLEPLMEKLERFLIRDHAALHQKPSLSNLQILQPEKETELQDYRTQIEQLELKLEEERSRKLLAEMTSQPGNGNFKKVADFIASKTGNLLSLKMSSELKKWMDELQLTPEFLLCMLELCFERSIFAPGEITRIAKDLKEYSISTLDGLESYFTKYVDIEKNGSRITSQFDPDIAAFGSFTGIEMTAEARKKVYYKWRYDWGFAHTMIMKAGEIMCQRTRNGGLEYIDSVLHNWMAKEIRQIEQVEKELREFKSRSKGEKASAGVKKDKQAPVEYELFLPPASKEIKSV
ncbi:MAG TPA: DnaD domain protein [Syntrophomonadaceae bacterium]|nr:DnaD domain protein [Syntrophomonadaceae bacterium]